MFSLRMQHTVDARWPRLNLSSPMHQPLSHRIFQGKMPLHYTMINAFLKLCFGKAKKDCVDITNSNYSKVGIRICSTALGVFVYKGSLSLRTVFNDSQCKMLQHSLLFLTFQFAGIEGISGVSLVAYSVLAWFKFIVAERLSSDALRTDGRRKCAVGDLVSKETVCCVGGKVKH